MSFLELPELEVAILGDSDVDRFFTELAFETTVLGILVKGGTVEPASEPPPSVRIARDWLRSGEAKGLQVRYQYGGTEWWATLMQTEDGVRLVRVKK